MFDEYFNQLKDVLDEGFPVPKVFDRYVVMRDDWRPKDRWGDPIFRPRKGQILTYDDLAIAAQKYDPNYLPEDIINAWTRMEAICPQHLSHDLMNDSLNEDTEKQGNYWVNKGKEGTHGKFKTKKEADAQRRAMFSNGFHEALDLDGDPERAENNYEALGVEGSVNLEEGEPITCAGNQANKKIWRKRSIRFASGQEAQEWCDDHDLEYDSLSEFDNPNISLRILESMKIIPEYYVVSFRIKNFATDQYVGNIGSFKTSELQASAVYRDFALKYNLPKKRSEGISPRDLRVIRTVGTLRDYEMQLIDVQNECFLKEDMEDTEFVEEPNPSGSKYVMNILDETGEVIETLSDFDDWTLDALKDKFWDKLIKNHDIEFSNEITRDSKTLSAENFSVEFTPIIDELLTGAITKLIDKQQSSDESVQIDVAAQETEEEKTTFNSIDDYDEMLNQVIEILAGNDIAVLSISGIEDADNWAEIEPEEFRVAATEDFDKWVEKQTDSVIEEGDFQQE